MVQDESSVSYFAYRLKLQFPLPRSIQKIESNKGGTLSETEEQVTCQLDKNQVACSANVGKAARKSLSY
jgi:hypothetical protein